MKRIIILTIPILALIMSCKVKENAPKAFNKDDMLGRGWSYYKDGKYDSAAAIFDSIINEIDPSDMEAHLGLGLSYAGLGYYSLAHNEFSLIYSKDLPSFIWDINLYVDTAYEDTIGNTYNAKANAELVGRLRVFSTNPPGITSFGQWRLGKILRENNVFPSDTAEYIYLITDISEIAISPPGTYTRYILGDDIYGYTDGLTYVDTFIRVSGGRLQLVDTVGPVLFLTSRNTGSIYYRDSIYLYSWLGNNTGDSIRIKARVYRIPRGGFPNAIVWLAIAADAYTYYIEGIDMKNAAALSLIAFWTRDIIPPFPERLKNLPGLSDGKEKKGLAAVNAQANFKQGMFAQVISMIRTYGNINFPSVWSYRIRTKTEVDTVAAYMRNYNYVRVIERKIHEVFYKE
ncbi:MAG: tetratricopeptide repeat protein [candidate division WOR-3 bacterium]